MFLSLLCYSMRHHVILCVLMSYCTSLCHAICAALLYFVSLCHTLSHYGILCVTISYCVLFCHYVIVCLTVSYCVSLYCITCHHVIMHVSVSLPLCTLLNAHVMYTLNCYNTCHWRLLDVILVYTVNILGCHWIYMVCCVQVLLLRRHR